MRLQLAISSALWDNPHGPDLFPFLNEVKQLGFDGVTGFAEWGWQEYIDDPLEFSRYLSDAGLALASMINGVHADFDQHRRVADFVAANNCRHLVLLGGRGKAPGDFAALGNLLNYIGEIALARGVRVSYHHHTDTTGETYDDINRLLAHTDPACVYVMCDTGHATLDFIELPLRERPLHYLRQYWDRLDLVEFKDWNAETGLNTPLGEGECDLHAVCALLAERDYSGWLIVEQNGAEGLSRGRSPVECARLSREYIRRSILESAIYHSAGT